jgi:hypothetical protein
MVIMKAKDDEDALRIVSLSVLTLSACYNCYLDVRFASVWQVNSCEYGLGSSVFSLNKARAEAIAARIRTGTYLSVTALFSTCFCSHAQLLSTQSARTKKHTKWVG